MIDLLLEILDLLLEQHCLVAQHANEVSLPLESWNQKRNNKGEYENVNKVSDRIKWIEKKRKRTPQDEQQST